MTNNVNLSDFAQLAQSLLKNKTEGKDYMLSQVYNMTRQAYERYPEDPVIKQFAFVIEKMLDKRATYDIITQSEMSGIYNNLVNLSGNTKFKSVLGELLHEPASITKTTHSADEFVNLNRVDANSSQFDESELVDQELVRAIGGAFGGSMDPPQPYDQKVAARGAEYVAIELNSLGFKPSINVLGGNKSMVMYGANFDTKNGLVTIAIPLDTTSDTLLLPSVFVAGDKVESLTADKLNEFISKAATGELPVYDKISEEYKSALNIEPKVEMPKELAHLAHDLDNDLLEAVSLFGKEAVRRGKGIVLAELGAAGFKNSQVRFGSDSSDCVIYIAAINTPKGAVEIEVPLDMKQGTDSKYTPLLPSCFACDGLIEDFTTAKLQRFALNRPAMSSGQIICSSENAYMTLPELRDKIIKSASQNDYVSCEMILGTIQDRFDESSYMNAVADYHYLLTLKSTGAEKDARRCSLEIAAGKGSIEKRCGHYGQPMSKVVVGKDGHCRLRSHIEKERLNPVKETGASISSTKLFWS